MHVHIVHEWGRPGTKANESRLLINMFSSSGLLAYALTAFFLGQCLNALKAYHLLYRALCLHKLLGFESRHRVKSLRSTEKSGSSWDSNPGLPARRSIYY